MMSSEASIDRLLDRVRELQRLLPAAQATRIDGEPHDVREEPPPEPQPDDEAAALEAATLDLLRQVTFVRVVLDRLYWERCPAALAKQISAKVKSPRDKGSLLLEYQFPFLDSDSDTLKKRVKAFAKTTLPTVVHFNHRRVALVKMSERLYRLWSGSSLWIRLYVQTTDVDGKHTMRQIGRCQLPLSGLLQLPFSLEAMGVVEGVGEWAGSRGRLQATLQLGSRNTAFSERLEMTGTELSQPPEHRRRSAAIAPSLDPGPGFMRKAARSLPAPPPRPASERDRSPPTRLDEEEIEDPFSPRRTARSSAFRPTYAASTPPPGAAPRDDDLLSHRAPQAKPHGGQPQSPDWANSAAQTDADARPLPPPSPFRPAHDAHNTTFSFGLSNTMEPATPSTPKMGRTRSQPHIQPPKIVPLDSEADRDGSPEEYWLNLTVHSGHNITRVKDDTGRSVAPSTFVSYRGWEGVVRSPVVPVSTDPVWNWTTRLRVETARRTLVLKLWHVCPLKGDRVLGFLSLGLPERPRKVSGLYDLIDLSQASLGALRIAMEPELDSVPSQPSPPAPTAVEAQLQAQTVPPVRFKDTELLVATGPEREDAGTNTSMSMSPAVDPSPRPPSTALFLDPYLEAASAEFLRQKLQRNMAELECLMGRLGRANDGPAPPPPSAIPLPFTSNP